MSKFYKKLVTASRPADPAVNTTNYNGIWNIKTQRLLQSAGIWNLGTVIPIDFLVVGGGGNSAIGSGQQPGGGGGGFIENLGVAIPLGKTISITAGTTATASRVSLTLGNVTTATYIAGGGTVGTSGSPQNNQVGTFLDTGVIGPGGGGAGGPGSAVSSNGGPGLFSTILGRKVAGGGGGGDSVAGFGTAGRGLDGGGNGSNSTNGTNATDYGGGGGAPQDSVYFNTGQGYPGVVIIRHLNTYNLPKVVTGNPTIVNANGYVTYTFFNRTGSILF
jgi:hypothetical protein